MPATLLDGKRIAAQLRSELAQDVRHLQTLGVTPGLTVVLVGDDAASQVYVRNKVNACEAAGMRSQLLRLPATVTQAELLAHIEALNADPAVHGILVQLPLPAQLSSQVVIEAIAPHKDVDGFHLHSVGSLVTGLPGFRPCTPLGVMHLLRVAGVPLRGAQAVVVGASNIVGKPMAMLLLQAGATVTICNSKTVQLSDHTRRADVLVVAVGRPGMVHGRDVKPGACVVDVGINRLADGRLVGDVDFDSAREVAGWLTPVPGGVGPMTIAMLLQNTVQAARQSLPSAESPT